MNENEKIIANLNKIYSDCDLKRLEEKYVETNKLIVTLTENLFDKKNCIILDSNDHFTCSFSIVIL